MNDNSSKVYDTIHEYLLDYVQTVVPPLFTIASHIGAKRKRDVSFAAHVLTATMINAIIYIYTRLSTGQKISTHDVKLVSTASTLHDIDKFWNGMTGSEYSGTWSELIRRYFAEGDDCFNDPFHLKEYFPEWETEFNEIVFLVQYTQESDKAQKESRYSMPKYGGLLPYVQIGDKIAALGKSDYPLNAIHKKLRGLNYDAQLVLFPELSQQLLSQNVYRAVKEFLVDNGGVPLIISPQGILYLSKEKIQLDYESLKYILGSELIEGTDARPVISFRRVDIDLLLSLPLDTETRLEKYLDTAKTTIEKGLLSELGSTIYPPDRLLQEALSAIIYFVYNDDQFKELGKFVNNEAVKEELRKIRELIDLFKKTDGIGGQKCKVYTVYELVNKCTDYSETLQVLHDPLMDAIKFKLSSNSDVLDKLVRDVTELNEDYPTTFMTDAVPRGNSENCFLCGEIAAREYKPGSHYFLQSGGFTKRATFKDMNKRYCDRCQIEFLLLNQLIKKSGFKTSDQLIFFYFYFDTIFFDVEFFLEQMSKVEITVFGTRSGRLPINIAVGNFETPFHIVPMAIRIKDPDPPKISTRRARAIHTAIQACLKLGCKCVLASPCTVLHTHNELFYNENPNALERNLEIDCVKHEDAMLIHERLSLINDIDGLKGLHEIQRFERINVIPYIKKAKSNYFNKWILDDGECVDKLFGDDNMGMKELADKGVALFGVHKFAKSHKKVKIFRTALDHTMTAISARISDEAAANFVASGVVKNVKAEKYSKKKGKDIEKDSLEYAQCLFSFLKEKGWFNLKSLAHMENELADWYEYEYGLAMKRIGVAVIEEGDEQEDELKPEVIEDEEQE